MADVSAFGPSFHIWVTLAVIAGGLVLYALEKTSIEVTSGAIVCALMVFFAFFPLTGDDGLNRLSPVRILQGFANPALITVLALMVMGHGMVRTGVIDRGARVVLSLGGKRGMLSVGLVLLVALVVSGFLNNTPVVVIFIPIMQILAERFRISVSKVMIPLSFAAVLGGMTTLLGSSTNLLVNGALIEMGETPFSFFDFTVPGLVLALVGFLYVLTVAPMLLPDRASLVQRLLAGEGKQYIAQITVSDDSHLVGKTAPGGIFAGLPDMTVRLVQRGEESFLPPFEGLSVRPGDILVVAATRKALREAVSHDPGLLYPDIGHGDEAVAVNRPWHGGERMMAEVLVVPASRMIGQTLTQIGFRHKTQCIVLGIQRRSRMIRMPMTEIRLAAGDVLLIQGHPDDIDTLKINRDVVLMEWSAEELPSLDHAKRASLIFVGVIGLAASGIMPIVVAALCGAVAMVASGVLNVRQASRAVDPRIVMAIGAALAMGLALQESGGAGYIAHFVVDAVGGHSVPIVLSILFILIAIFTNVISNNACAVLFTPIAVDMAAELGVSPMPFAVAVVFAANCSFASPLGYQTNLLVMGPGHNRFLDFTRVGIPLIVLLWATFVMFVPWYYGL